MGKQNGKRVGPMDATSCVHSAALAMPGKLMSAVDIPILIMIRAFATGYLLVSKTETHASSMQANR